VIQEVVDEFIIKRRAHGKPRLRWRVSRGPKRSLGWVPFTNQDIAIDGATVVLRGQRFCIWKHRDIYGKLKSGSFNRDARGRWYCNLVVEVERPAATNRFRRRRCRSGVCRKRIASVADRVQEGQGHPGHELVHAAQQR
jgi:hypothetical protein